MGKAVIISSPSGGGKHTLVHYLFQQNLNLEFSVSATTRPPREGEAEGRDYYFLDQDTFEKKISNDEFLEWEEVYPGKYYGTLKSELERIWELGKHVVFEIDVKGAVNVKQKFREEALAIFLKPPSLQILRQRLEDRGTDPTADIEQRLQTAAQELEYETEFDKVILNDELETAQEELATTVATFLKQ